ETEMSDADAFRREGRQHPDERCRDHQAEASGIGNPCLSGCSTWFSLRRARKLQRPGFKACLVPLDGVFEEARDEVRLRTTEHRERSSFNSVVRRLTSVVRSEPPFLDDDGVARPHPRE